MEDFRSNLIVLNQILMKLINTTLFRDAKCFIKTIIYTRELMESPNVIRIGIIFRKNGFKYIIKNTIRLITELT